MYRLPCREANRHATGSHNAAERGSQRLRGTLARPSRRWEGTLPLCVCVCVSVCSVSSEREESSELCLLVFVVCASAKWKTTWLGFGDTCLVHVTAS
eukprot:COSAG06_NODE_368_length_16746_cov_12.229771_12_plen_97_part_00